MLFCKYYFLINDCCMVLFLVIFGIGWTLIILFSLLSWSFWTSVPLNFWGLLDCEWLKCTLNSIKWNWKVYWNNGGGGVLTKSSSHREGRNAAGHLAPGLWTLVGISPSLVSDSLPCCRLLSPHDGNMTTTAPHFTAVATRKSPTWHSLWFKPPKDPRKEF